MPVPQEIDEYELVDPVDILTPLEKTGFWNGVVSAPHCFMKICTHAVFCQCLFVKLAYLQYFFFQKATKWSERKDAVAELTKLASTKKIAPGDFTEICRTLKKVLK